MDDRTCTACKWFVVNCATPDYSEFTPGGPMGFTCWKNHWELDQYEVTQGSLHKLLKTAETCSDFVVSEEIAKL